MELTKKEKAEGRKLIKKHIREDPSGTYVEILMCLIEQNSPYLKEVIRMEKES